MSSSFWKLYGSEVASQMDDKARNVKLVVNIKSERCIHGGRSINNGSHYRIKHIIGSVVELLSDNRDKERMLSLTSRLYRSMCAYEVGDKFVAAGVRIEMAATKMKLSINKKLLKNGVSHVDQNSGSFQIES